MTPTADEIKGLLRRMSAACAKAPTPQQIEVAIESIIDNQITGEELRRGYASVRDAEEPWWPTPGKFLKLCRPPVPPSVISGEAEALFQLLIDNPTAYGTYSPHCGVVYDRRRVEEAHGPAAGIAFAAVSSRFRGLTIDALPFVRRDFAAAYGDARASHAAPDLTPPSHRLQSSQVAAQIKGATSSNDQTEEFRARVLQMPPRGVAAGKMGAAR